MTTTNPESDFQQKFESPIKGDGRKIQAIDEYNGYKSYQFKMDENTDKELTPNEIKEIIKNEYNYCVESITLMREDNTEFKSGKCKAGDIIRIYVNLSMNEDTETIEESDRIDDYRFDDVQLSDNTEVQGESPYKEMIESQTGPITHGNRDNPAVALTFDDGYGKGNIEHILNKLKNSNIHATFFILGDCLKNTPALWRRAIEEGHQICCHTYSHIYLSDGEYTDLGNKEGGISAGPGKLNKTDLKDRVKNVKELLGEDYLNDIKSKNGTESDFPRKIKTDLLLKTEILMWEAQVKQTLGNKYLQKFKQQYPFFRFPGGCGANYSKNIDMLKELGYLSIGWSDDFYRGTGSNRKHMSTESVGNVNVTNGDIPLFHFKEADYKYIDKYIDNISNKGKQAVPLTDIIK